MDCLQDRLAPADQQPLSRAKPRQSRFLPAAIPTPSNALSAAPLGDDTVPFTFVVQAFFALHRPGWKSAKHAHQWLASLESTVLPIFGHRAIGAVTKLDILRAIEPLWIAKTDTAQRVLQRTRRVIEWAAARDMRPDHKPAMWDEIRRALPPAASIKPPRRHHPACQHHQVADALGAVRALSSGAAVKDAIVFAVLTAARPGEVRLMRWQEIDWKAACWTIPAEHTKRRRAHRIPLSDQALSLLRGRLASTRDEGVVFPGAGGRPLTGAGLLKALRSIGPQVTVHGFRSTLRDWTAEETNYPHQVCEAVLAHQAAHSATEGAYLRSDLFERRRQLMQDWADYCLGPAG